MSDEPVPCKKDGKLQARIEQFSDILRLRAHELEDFGMSEQDFYQTGIFDGAIQRIRGQISAQMGEKKDFVNRVLSYMQDREFIKDWEPAGGANRHDYSIMLPSGRVAALELKGCLDGNNTNISERPPHANEFIVWSLCQNKGADPRKNVWSGIHTRMSADIIADKKRVDGLIVWDWLCATAGRHCPKVASDQSNLTELGPWKLPPPCLYLFPGTVPAPRNNPSPAPHSLTEVEFMSALHACFGGADDQVHHVWMEAAADGVETVRTTRIKRGGQLRKESKPTPIRRS